MKWIDGNSEIRQSLYKVAIRVTNELGFYFTTGVYDYDDDTWWDVNINKRLSTDSVQYLDESTEPDQDILWDELVKIAYGKSEEEVLPILKQTYTLTRK